MVNICIVEGFLRHEVHNVVIAIHPYHRTVHPCLVFGNEGKVGVGVVENHSEQLVAENEVALDEQRVVFSHLLLHHRQGIDIVGLVVNGVLGIFDVEASVVSVADILAQFIAFVTHHDDDASERQRGKLTE